MSELKNKREELLKQISEPFDADEHARSKWTLAEVSIEYIAELEARIKELERFSDRIRIAVSDYKLGNFKCIEGKEY